MLFVTQHWVAFQMFTLYTRVMGRFTDVVWYDLNRMPRMGVGGILMLVARINLDRFD